MDDASLSTTRRCRFLICSALLVAAVGCSTYIGTTSKSFMMAAKDNTDPNIRYIAYAKLGSPAIYDNKAQKDNAVLLLISKLEEAKEPVAVRAVIVRSLGNLGDHRARQQVVKAVHDFENAVIRVEACRALGKVGLPEDATILAQIMTIDKLEDCRIAAIEGLGLLKAADPRIYEILLAGLENDDPAIRLECLRSLRAITGKDFGVTPAAWRTGLEPTIKDLTAAAAKTASPGQMAMPAKTSPPR
jgi:HEAT repeats